MTIKGIALASWRLKLFLEISDNYWVSVRDSVVMYFGLFTDDYTCKVDTNTFTTCIDHRPWTIDGGTINVNVTRTTEFEL